MDPAAYLDAHPIIQIHILAATAALLLGPAALRLRGPGRLHKALGRAWVGAMAILSLSSFGIHGFALIGPFGPIHLLSAATLATLVRGVAHARAGRIAAHRATFHDLYWYGLGIAGAFTLLPERRMNRLLFDDAPWLGGVAVAAILAALAIKWGLARRRRAQLSDRATFMSLT